MAHTTGYSLGYIPHSSHFSRHWPFDYFVFNEMPSQRHSLRTAAWDSSVAWNPVLVPLNSAGTGSLTLPSTKCLAFCRSCTGACCSPSRVTRLKSKALQHSHLACTSFPLHTGIPKVMHYGLLFSIDDYKFDKHWHFDFDVTVCPPWDSPIHQHSRA
eukprot:scaffold232035_cov18-Tisochrysis_lutea.AAC.1